MPLNGAITAKYKEHKRVNPHDVDDWCGTPSFTTAGTANNTTPTV